MDNASETLPTVTDIYSALSAGLEAVPGHAFVSFTLNCPFL